VNELDALLKAHRSDAARMPAPAVSRFTRDEIITAIRGWNDRYGEPPQVVDWDPSWARRRGEDWRAERFEGGSWPTAAIVRRQFGNMSKALFAAGLRPRRGPTRGRSHILSDEEILEAIREWTRMYGEPPAIADWSPARARSTAQAWRIDRYYAGNWPSGNTVVRRFGRFSEATRRAGLDPRPRGRHTSARPTLKHDAHEVIQLHLGAKGRGCGPGILAGRVRSVAEARVAEDPEALRGALIELAAAALSWAEVVDAGHHTAMAA
jgi:hypothetical protein